jgi:hypothetical protein
MISLSSVVCNYNIEGGLLLIGKSIEEVNKSLQNPSPILTGSLHPEAQGKTRSKTGQKKI